MTAPATRHRRATGALSVIVAVLVGSFAFPDSPASARMAAVAVLMALWWVLEVAPLAVTSLLPLVLLPALDLVSLKATAANYGKPIVFLFLGGFALALGLQRSQLHRRIALSIVARLGSQGSRLLFGFMLASAGLSMWISNTATVMVCMPIALSVLEEARAAGVDKQRLLRFGTALMLGVAYAADIGGMATPVGTPPNLVLMELQSRLLPELPAIAFNQWVAMGVPFSAVFLVGGWWLLARPLFRLGREPILADGDELKESLRSLGRMRRDEKVAGIVFSVVALLWMTGADLDLGSWGVVPGWRGALGLPHLEDASVAIAGAVVLFLLPSNDRPGQRLLTWDYCRTHTPWGLLLLFGGGFALAHGFSTTGLSAEIGGGLTALAGLSPPLLVGLVSLVLTFLTELTSNTATTTLVLPILADGSTALGVDPRVLMIPATLSASCAFMMPVASPTQAIVFGSGYVSIRQMVRAGIWFNLFGVIWVTVYFVLVGTRVFGIEL